MGAMKSNKPRELPEKIMSIGVDYIMATTKSLDKADRWQHLWKHYYNGLGDNAYLNVKDGRWRGYHTRELPGFMVGTRRDGAIIRLTGETAGLLYQTVEPMVSKITRLDLQCTYDFAKPYPELAQLYREVLLESGYNKTHKPVIIDDSGQTLYLGSFSSAHFGRIYDRAKSEGLKTVGKRWRYEVVWRNDKAQHIYRTLRQYPVWLEKQEAMYSIVYNWFAKHWCDLPEGKPPQKIEMSGIGAKIKTTDTQLHWLRTGVKPAIGRMINGGVDKERILEALGLGC